MQKKGPITNRNSYETRSKKPKRGLPSEFRTPLPLLSIDRTFGDFGGSIVSH
jgi:hypothetical protein